MDRKIFLKKCLFGIGTAVAVPSLVTSCNNDDAPPVKEPTTEPNDCVMSPAETAGPFPIRNPTQLVRQNIIGGRKGIPLTIRIKVENTRNNCQPLQGALVDIWHCDAQGNYSEYRGQLDGNFRRTHFLRGRQVTGSDGFATFKSIYPGWYPGRAPHLHLEVLRADETSLLITQTAFPEEISKKVYATNDYKGIFDTPNADDGIFEGSLNRSMATSVTGNTTDGYTLTETIKVAY